MLNQTCYLEGRERAQRSKEFNKKRIKCYVHVPKQRNKMKKMNQGKRKVAYDCDLMDMWIPEFLCMSRKV